MLQVIDDQWKDHLLSMDHLKEGIGLRGYGQKDPLVEYKKESFDLFQDMMDRIEDETVRYLFFLQVAAEAGGRPVLPFPPTRTKRRTKTSDGMQPSSRAAAAAGRGADLHAGLHPQYPAQEGEGAGGTAVRRRRRQHRRQ